MGILQRIRSAKSPADRLLERLAEIAGHNRELADRLARHAKLCACSNIATGLNTLAERETDHAGALSTILSGRHAWSRLARPIGAEGSNNWERLGGDLAMMLELSHQMNEQVIGWERIDPPLADRLRAIMVEDDRSLDELRELALLCDPQALD